MSEDAHSIPHRRASAKACYELEEHNAVSTIPYAAALGLCFAPVFILCDAQAAEEMPKEIIAAQIRDQGYTCDKPLSAERGRESSASDDAVWILKCENATYRVRLIPDMAAKVERLD